ncbi:MAG: hypothetical protein KC944_06875 [Candidatus Omnitrophica bacterium]|nr:hypothetical protein [Candidatus Omnitrophota bacterium]
MKRTCLFRSAIFLIVCPLLVLSTIASSGELPVRKPIATIGGGVGALCSEDHDRLWAAVGEDLVLFNVTDPSNIYIESKLHLEGGLNQTVKNGNVLHALGKENKFWTIDIEDPLDPKILKEISLERPPKPICFMGDQGLILDGSKVKVFDFSEPRDPKPIQEFQLDHWPNLIQTGGTLGFTGRDREGIRIYDLSAPGGPEEVGRYPLDRYPGGLVMKDSTAYIVESQMGIHVVDLSNPANPQKVSYIEDRNVMETVQLFQNYLCLPGSKPDLTIYDVSDAHRPTKVAEIDSPAGTLEVLLTDGRIFLPSEGLKVYDFSTPSDPRFLGKYSHPHLPKFVYYRSNIAYVGGDASEIALVDCSEPKDPRVKGFVQLKGTPRCLTGIGKYLYVAGNEFGLEVYDLTEPLKPEKIHHDGRFQKVHAISFGGNLAAAAEWNGEVQIFDIADPSHPNWVTSYDSGSGSPYNAEWLDEYMIVAGGRSGLQLVDVTYPFSPVFKNLIGLEKGVSHITLLGKTAVLTAQQSPAAWFDFSDPIYPKKLGELEETPTSSLSWKDHIVLTGNQGGQVYDFVDPLNPKKVAVFEDGLNSQSAIFGDLLFAPTWWKGLRIFDLEQQE